MKRALIIGVSGQDGAYLSQLLLSKGYEVYGTSRNINNNTFQNLKILNIFEKIKLLYVDTKSEDSIRKAFEYSQPDEIYNVSGQSSVGRSFDCPLETTVSIVDATRNILSVILTIDTVNSVNRERTTNKEIRFFSAGSGECFGDTTQCGPASEATSFNPHSPYAEAKAEAFGLVKEAREKEGIFACTGILFNHESPLRPAHFVTQKIIQGAISIAKDIKEGRTTKKLHLGNLAIRRDWGWAPEYVEAMWFMLRHDQADDFVVATGVTHSLEQFVELAFSKVNLAWRDHVVVDQALFRPNEALEISADPIKARIVLGWEANSSAGRIIDNSFMGEFL